MNCKCKICINNNQEGSCKLKEIPSLNEFGECEEFAK